MAEPSRYNTSKAQAGIDGHVLKNKFKIEDQQTLDDLETVLLSDAYHYFLDHIEKEKMIFNLALLFDIHYYFLHPLYSWAGKLRTVDISKDGILFASVRHLKDSIKVFEKILKRNLPKSSDAKKSIAKKLSIIHNEFNAIHPFREGNGRTIRLFLDLIAIDSGFKPIHWNKSSHMDYLKACQRGMVQDHNLMTKIIYKGLLFNNIKK